MANDSIVELPPGTFVSLEEDRALCHVALNTAVEGIPLDRTQMTDQQRLSVVLQAAALLSHCEHGGWFLASGWDDVRWTGTGLIRVTSLRRGRPGQLVQVQLRQLLKRLFRTEKTIAGRGEARRIARYLTQRWQQILAPITADQAVSEILEATPFLWSASFANVRSVLAAEHRVDGRSYLWMAGPGAARRRFFAKAGDLQQLQALLRGAEAYNLWDGWCRETNPAELTAKRKWQRAVAAWRREPPRSRREVLDYARCLYALGRYSQTLDVLKRQRHIDARLLRASAQLFNGELNAALATVKRLALADLSADRLVELTEVAVRLLAFRRRTAEIPEWVAQCLAKTRGKARLKAAIVAVGAAFDCDDLTAMDQCLDESRDALGYEDLAGSWHHMRGLRSIKAKDGPGAVEHISTALRLDRRRLLRARAARLWNDLAIGRAHADDLPGAERALMHAQRLLQDTDGPSRTTLAFFNLAEVRLRLGSTEGVESILERSTAENRRSGNLRGLMQDLELWVRLELVQGRPSAALARCTEAFVQADSGDVNERGGVFEAFSARAYGWLGRQRQAALSLDRMGPDSILELELEERPAIWALAGIPDRALTEAAGTRWERLWSALTSGSHPGSDVWGELRSLEPYRAARLIFDCELVLPGVAPPRLVRRAVSTLRQCGASAFAEKLESCSLSSWRALDNYLARPAVTTASVSELLTHAGYGDVHLTWKRSGQEKVVLSGAGGETELSAEVDGGRLILRAPVVDSVLKTLFAVICRDLRPLKEERPVKHPSVAYDGIVGESPGLREALRRLDRLASDDLSILILGESGTGKELLAQRAHRISRRCEGPFRPVNCAELSETLTRSDLFGHVKGSFTGADRTRPGVFESAQSGTVFLDEIGDLPPSAQGKLLRVLQESEIRRVGESFARKIDVRVIAATHRDLEEMVRQGSFRQDLFFRLKVATVVLPPLRDRGHDVLLLADHFLSRRSPACFLVEDARTQLASYRWPGNVRELQNVLRVAAALSSNGEIHSEHLDLPNGQESILGDYHQVMEECRRKLVTEALAATDGNQAAAARRLGLTRQALSYHVRRLGLS